MAKILVTGSAGLLGSHLVDHLIEEGHEVQTIDNLSTGFRTNLNPNVLNHPYDLIKIPGVVDLIIRDFEPQIVYHLAAWPHEGLSAFCPRRISENNYNATLNILVPSIKHGVKRFVFTSSMARYGDQVAPFSEGLEPKPVDVYGISKVASERVIQTLSEVHGIDWTIIVPHNLIGPRQSLSDPYRNVAGIFIRRALQGKNLIIYGDGEQKRSFSYVTDGVRALAKAAFEPRASKQVINIGPTEEFTINQLADEIIFLSGGNIGKEYLPPRPLEVKYAWCTNDRAKNILGFETTIPFKEGVQRMWEWAKNLQETTGIAEPRYLDQLELENEKTPRTWVEKSL